MLFCLASAVITVLAGLVQVSFGAYSMTVAEAWAAVYDPDVIAVRQNGRVTEEEFESQVVSHMRDHEVASDLTAVKEDRVVRGGTLYQGPIVHLFQLEQAAQDLYPDVFGGEELFERQRVADVVTGEF